MTKYFEIPVFKWTLTLSCRGHNSAAIKKAFSRICKGFDGIVGHQPLQWIHSGHTHTHTHPTPQTKMANGQSEMPS